MWDERDGSLYVTFPYFAHSEGIVSLITLPPDLSYPANVSFAEGGKVTSHLVKYAHHRDGEAHFSQDGKVVTAIRKRSVQLSRYSGHLFTVQIQGVDGFKEGSDPDYDPENTRDQPITFDLFESGRKAIKVLGYWYDMREVRSRASGASHLGPGVNLKGHPTATQGALVSAPLGKPGSGSILVLTVVCIPSITTDLGSHLTFIWRFRRRDRRGRSDQTDHAAVLLVSGGKP